MYCMFCVLCIVCVYMCTELLPPGGYPIAVNYIVYHIKLVFRILTKDMQKRKIFARWVPHCLTAEQKQKRLEKSAPWQSFRVQFMQWKLSKCCNVTPATIARL